MLVLWMRVFRYFYIESVIYNALGARERKVTDF